MKPIIVSQNEKLDLTILDCQKNNPIHIQAEDDSKIRLSVLCQKEGSPKTLISARLKNNVELEINFASLNQKNGEHEIEVVCQGNNSKTNINTAFEVKKNQYQKLKISNIFEGQNNTGAITINGILEDLATCDLEGRIVIKKSGTQTDSQLTEKILLLGEKSICNAKPILEIDTDDVKASHGASISRISREDLFYLCSRGLSEKEAHSLLKAGLLLAPFVHSDKDPKFLKELNKNI